MRFTFHSIASLAGLTVALTAGTALADFSLDQIVPENAVLVAGVHNVEQSLERFRNSPLHDLMNAPEFSEQRDEFKKEFMDGWNEFLAEMGVDEDVQPWPTGAAGMALYPVMDPELGTSVLAMVTFAEYGENADAMMELVQKGITRAEEEGTMIYEELDVLGRTVHVLDFGAARDDEEEEAFDDDPFGMMMPDFSRLFDSFLRMYLVREGDGLIFATDLGSLTESLERMDRGEAGLGGREEYRRVLDQLGENDGFGMVLTRDLVSMLSGADQSGMMMMVGPMAKSVFGDIKGIGTSIRMDTPNAMLEQAMAVYMPNGKSGLARLVDVKQPREDLPPFISPNSTMYVSVNVAFDQLTDVVRNIIQTNPMIQMGAGEGFNQIEPTMRELMATLGSRFYMSSTLRRPITIDSASTLIAVECREEQAFENIFAQFAPEMALEPRDFLGHRIYSTDPDMNMMAMMTGMDLPTSLGIGGGYIFVGTTPSVEQALRVVGQQDRLPTLGEEPAYQRAIRALPERPLLSWQYVDMVSHMEGSMRVMELRQAEMMERMREDFPELAEEMEGDMDAEFSAGEIDWDVIRRYIGPAVSFVEPTEDGFVGTTYYLAADPNDR